MIAICLRPSEVPLAKYVDDSYVKFRARGQRFIFERVAQIKLTSTAYEVSRCDIFVFRLFQWVTKIVLNGRMWNNIYEDYVKLLFNLYKDKIIYLINLICEIIVYHSYYHVIIHIVIVINFIMIRHWRYPKRRKKNLITAAVGKIIKHKILLSVSDDHNYSLKEGYTTLIKCTW